MASSSTRFLSALSGSLMVAGCVRASVPPAQTPETTLRQTVVALQEAFTARDPERIANFFAEDAIAMYPLPQPTIGREANRRAWQSYYSRRTAHPVSIDTVVASASGDLGYAFGKYLTADVQDPAAAGGRYVAVWRRIGDQWRIAVLSAHDHPDITRANFAPR